jgi:hypothetical protein
VGVRVPVARPTRKTARDVFINVPFDSRYEPLYLALITGLVGLGLKSRCVVELSHERHRLERILDLIAACPFSIHDLSRVQLAATMRGFRVPRFNMPFELGLAVAAGSVAARTADTNGVCSRKSLTA